MALLIKAAMAQALAMSRAVRPWPHTKSQAMQPQLTSKGTVLACGPGDQGAIHGSTMSRPKNRGCKKLSVLRSFVCVRLLKIRPSP
jgi:hypothetical protein